MEKIKKFQLVMYNKNNERIVFEESDDTNHLYLRAKLIQPVFFKLKLKIEENPNYEVR